MALRQFWAASALCFVAICLALSGSAFGEETVAERKDRLAKMTDDQKIELQRKKERFDELSKETQEKLRNLHTVISSDPNAKELEETVRRYNQWLASLESPQRAALLSIQNPTERILRIKELMQQQEDRRFREFSYDLPEEDRKTIQRWLQDFVSRHADEIRRRLPDEAKKRIDDSPEEQRPVELLNAWQRFRRQLDLPYPAQEDTKELVPLLSTKAQNRIMVALPAGDAQAAADTQHQRVVELIRAVNFSRFMPHVSNEELLKFYHAMKPDDPRRERLEGLEKDKLYDELRRMWNFERYAKRGGPGFQRGGPPGQGGPPWQTDGRGGGFRPDGKGFGGKGPPGDKEFPPPPPPK